MDKNVETNERNFNRIETLELNKDLSEKLAQN